MIPSGYGNTGTLRGNFTFSNNSISRNINTALNFDGSDDDISIDASESLGFSTDFSISAWVYYKSTGATRYIIGRSGDIPFYTDSSGELELLFYDGGWTTVPSTVNLIGNTCNHVVVSVDFTSLNVHFYVNNNKVTKTTGGKTSVRNNGGDFLIGQYGNFDYWSGNIDDMRIYKKVLNDSEVTDLFSEGN